MNRMHPRALASAALFLATIVAANYLTTHYGLVSIGFGLAVTAGTFAAGFALYARDEVQDAAGRTAVVALIIVGALLSYVVSSGRIALASGVAFCLSELCDMAVYTPLRERSWAGAVVASNAVGGLVDSLVFLSVAGFGLTVGNVAGQWLVKMAVTVATVALVGGARYALRRNAIEPRNP
jgi:hypothetical protein